jgi:hypothetical protein
MDTKEVFGLDIENSDDELNIYATYDLENECVADMLEVVMVMPDGNRHYHEYNLSEAEKELICNEMNWYCSVDMGKTIPEIKMEAYQSTP